MAASNPDFSTQGLNLYDLYRRIYGRIGMPFPLGRRQEGDAEKSQDFTHQGVLEVVRNADDFELPAVVKNSIEGFSEVELYKESGFVKGFSRVRGQLGSYYFMPTMIDDWQLPNEPLVSIQMQKRIVRTVVAGANRNGTVKELVSAEDAKINIKGLIINEQNPERYPEEEVRRMRQIFAKRAPLTIKNKLCNLWGVNVVVVTQCQMEPEAGYQGVQPYTLTLESDTNFEFELLTGR